jgi:hypothetical protein
MAEYPRLNLSAFEQEWLIPSGPAVERIREQRRRLLGRVLRVAHWWVARWPLPVPAGRADTNAALLLKRLPTADVVALVKFALPAITQSRKPFECESAISAPAWGSLCKVAGRSVEAYLAARATSPRPFLTVLEAVLQQGGATAPRAATRFVPTAGALFVTAMKLDDVPRFPKLVEAFEARLIADLEPEPVRERLRAWVRSTISRAWRHDVSEAKMGLLRAAIDVSLVKEELSSADIGAYSNWATHSLLGQATSVAPHIVVPTLRRFWSERVDWEGADYRVSPVIRDSMAGAPELIVDGLAVELGFEASQSQKEFASIDSEQIVRRYATDHLGGDMKPPFPTTLLDQTRLWSLLRRLKGYDRWGDSPETRGVTRDISEFMDAHPAVWALALPLLLPRANDIPLIEVLTVILAHQNDAVRAALEAEAARGATAIGQDRAKGILATLDGLSNPGVAFAETLLTFAARQLDGTPIFPHPLALRSSTWLGDLSTETLLRESIERAAAQFADYFLGHAGIEEEAITAQLLAELEFAFRSSTQRARSVGGAKRPPAIVVSRRQVPKGEEEQIGCDLALILRGEVRGTMDAVWAEFVQVKKPLRSGAGFADRWRITLTTQLDDLLRTSQTSCYWLIGAGGEIFVVPTKVLYAMKRGRATKSASMNVSYHEIRSSAIPLAQSLMDLFSGGWIGTSAEQALITARGEDRGFVPREIFEIRVHTAQG